MTAKTMAEVLAEHQWYDATTDSEDPATGCTGCDDWFGSEDALDDGTFAAHQAAALSAAGFGLVADAKAEAWDEGWAARAWRDPVYRVPDTNPYRATP
jgi:hypothetical protein